MFSASVTRLFGGIGLSIDAVLVDLRQDRDAVPGGRVAVVAGSRGRYSASMPT